MPLTPFIALRYLRSKKGNFFFSLLAGLAFFGITVSVTAFLVIASVMNGFSHHLAKSLLGFNAHIELPFKDVKTEDAAAFLGKRLGATVTPVFETDGILKTEDGKGASVRMRGLAAKDFAHLPGLEITYFEDFSLPDLEPSGELLPGLLIGEDLFWNLSLPASDKWEVSLINPLGPVGPTGEIEPISRDFRIVGLFRTGYYDIDNHFILGLHSPMTALVTPEDKAQKQRFLIRLPHGTDTLRAVSIIKNQWPDSTPVRWEEKNKRLFSALKMEKAGMFLLLILVTVMAVFNVVGLMSLFVSSKERDLAALTTMGLSRDKLFLIFVTMGGMLTVAGILLGSAIGMGIVSYISAYPLPLPDAYYIDTLPVKTDWRIFLVFLAVTLTGGLLSAYVPSRNLSKLNPSAILRET